MQNLLCSVCQFSIFNIICCGMTYGEHMLVYVIVRNLTTNLELCVHSMSAGAAEQGSNCLLIIYVCEVPRTTSAA